MPIKLPVGKYERSEEWRKKKSLAWKEWLSSHPHPRLGKKMAEESKIKMRKPHLSERGRIKSDEHRKNISLALKGKNKSEEHRESLSGSNHWNWQGGKTGETKRIRNSFEYKLWRRLVFERDNYTCVMCGRIGGELAADHIKPFSLFPGLRFSIENGRTLCGMCHKKTETFALKSVYQKQKVCP